MFNVISHAGEGKDIWHPKVLMYNTKKKEESTVYTTAILSSRALKALPLKYDTKSVLLVEMQGKSSSNSIHELQHSRQHGGSDNDIALYRAYTTPFTCSFDLRLYPFDTQNCSMKFIMQVLHVDTRT